MQPKIFVMWLAAALVALVAAMGVLVTQPEVSTVQVADELVFPDLGPNKGQVAKISITTSAGESVLTRNDAGNWIVPEFHDFPADDRKVDNLLLGLAALRLSEAKTNRPERYARLEVEDIVDDESKSRFIRLETEAGDVLAEAYIGKRRPGLAGDRDTGTYIRRIGDDRVWLAAGAVDGESKQRGWLQAIVIDVSRPDVKRVEMAPFDGQPYAAGKETREDEYFKLEGLLEDQEPMAESSGIGLARLLTEVRFDEVKLRADVPFPPEAIHVMNLITFDGVKVTAELVEIEEKGWVNFTATYVGDPADESEGAKAAREQVAEINRLTNNWSLQVPRYIFSRLTAPVTDLLKGQEIEALSQVPGFGLPQVPGLPLPPNFQMPPPGGQPQPPIVVQPPAAEAAPAEEAPPAP